MIVITGATGALNGATVDHLLARDVTKAERFARLGITVRHGDYAQPDTLPAAFADADQLLLVSSSDPKADAVSLHRAAIEAASAAGVRRVLYTSHQGAAFDTPFGPGRDHAATERMLAESGLEWTSLRNGFYAHSLAWVMGPWRDTGVFTVPSEGRMSWTARSDSAEAAAIILASDAPGAPQGSASSPSRFDGPVTLTAGPAPTFAEIAAIASEVGGRIVELQVLGEEAWIASRVEAGQPEYMARFMLGMYEAAEGGFFAGVDPLLGDLLGREPLTVRDQLEEQLAAVPGGSGVHG